MEVVTEDQPRIKFQCERQGDCAPLPPDTPGLQVGITPLTSSGYAFTYTSRTIVTQLWPAGAEPWCSLGSAILCCSAAIQQLQIFQPYCTFLKSWHCIQHAVPRPKLYNGTGRAAGGARGSDR